jgi:Leucine-rich repeat (LRR) protein
MIGSNERSAMRVDTILQQACSNGVLRLANRNLTEVPREVFFLQETDYKDKRWWEEQQLTVLDVSNNLITSIPMPSTSTTSQSAAPSSKGEARGDDDVGDGLGGFSQLRLLNASYNKLVAFPSALLATCSRSLTKLELSHNQLNGEGLPFASPTSSNSDADCRGRSGIVFESLLELDVSHNRLQCLRNLISSCPRLEKLNASNNQLAAWVEAGEEVAVAVSLRHVDLSNNNLPTLWWAGPHASCTTLAHRCPNLMYLYVSRNKITCDGVDPRPSLTGLQPAAFPSTLVTLDLKYNQLGRWPLQLFGGAQSGSPPLSNLKELYLGRNSLPTPPPSCSPLAAAVSSLPSLEMLDASDNQIQDATFLLELKQSLARLDLQNNNLSTLPAELGLFPRLKNIVLDGNPLRAIRRDVIAKGTVELLAFLRDRLAPGVAGNDAAKASQQIRTLDAHVIQAEQQLLPPAAAAAAAFVAEPQDPMRHMLGRRAQQQSTQAQVQSTTLTSRGGQTAPRVDDRPFATAFNATAVISDEVKTLNSACIRAGEHNGTTWDLSAKGGSSGGTRPAVAAGRRVGGPLSNGPGAGNSGVLVDLPEVVSHALNFAELHSSTEEKFRDSVLVISLEYQPTVKSISLDFLFPFPKLRELKCSRCHSLETLHIAAAHPHTSRQRHGEETPSPLSSLSALDFSNCSFASAPSSDGSLHASSSLDPAFQLLASWSTPISRVNLAFNPRLCALPTSLTYFAKSLQYIRLDGNPNLGGPQSLHTFQVLGQLNQLLELSVSRCNITDMPADGATATSRHVDLRKGFCESSWPRLLLLDVSSNELSNVPNTIGLMKGHLRQLALEGNKIRWLRHETLSKGTVAVLQYLEDRIPR